MKFIVLCSGFRYGRDLRLFKKSHCKNYYDLDLLHHYKVKIAIHWTFFRLTVSSSAPALYENVNDRMIYCCKEISRVTYNRDIKWPIKKCFRVVFQKCCL